MFTPSKKAYSIGKIVSQITEQACGLAVTKVTRQAVFFVRMIHCLMLCKTQPHVNEAKLDQMMISARVSLVKIPEVSGVRCGKNVDQASPWQFFVAIDVDNTERLGLLEQDPIYIKFQTNVLNPNVSERLVSKFEMEPGKSIKLS
jgi:hypothetical protein